MESRVEALTSLCVWGLGVEERKVVHEVQTGSGPIGTGQADRCRRTKGACSESRWGTPKQSVVPSGSFIERNQILQIFRVTSARCLHDEAALDLKPPVNHRNLTYFCKLPPAPKAEFLMQRSR